MTDDPRATEALQHLLNAATELIAAARAALDVAESVVDRQRDRAADQATDEHAEPKVQRIRVMDR